MQMRRPPGAHDGGGPMIVGGPTLTPNTSSLVPVYGLPGNRNTKTRGVGALSPRRPILDTIDLNTVIDDFASRNAQRSIFS